MFFFVIEHFKNGDPLPVRERFQDKGRLVPDGVTYVGSWIDPKTATCYQVMEAEARDLIDEWSSRWSDIVDFEIFDVLSSPDYWAAIDEKYPR